MLKDETYKRFYFEGLRVIGDAWETSKKYSSLGIDEIFTLVQLPVCMREIV